MDLNVIEPFALWLWLKAQWAAAPAFGSMVSFLVGKDFSLKRAVGGVSSALFMAYYFTDALVYYMPAPPNMPPEQQRTMAAALLGLTGYILVSRIIELAQTWEFSTLLGFLKGKGKS